MNRLQLPAAAVVALALAGTCAATPKEVGKPSATSPPPQYQTTGHAFVAVDLSRTGKPTATSPPAGPTHRASTLIAESSAVDPATVGKPSSTTPPVEHWQNRTG